MDIVNKKVILIVGSGNEETIKLLLEGVFGIECMNGLDIYSETFENSKFRIKVSHPFYKSFFEIEAFKKSIQKIKKEDLAAILCLENLTPRAERLSEDLRLLKESFNTDELRENIYLFFTYTDSKREGNILENLRQQFLSFDGIFNELNCQSPEAFVRKRVWVLDRNHVNLLKAISFKNNVLASSVSQNEPPKGSRKWKVFLLGPVGSGKSTTGNYICDANFFSKGNTMSRVTIHAKLGESEKEWIVLDTPGLSDATSGTTGDLVFLEEMVRVRDLLQRECPFDGFVMIIKFNLKESPAFKKCAERFVRSFSQKALESLMILCIQGNTDTIYSDSEFHEILTSSEGYSYLMSKTNNKAIPYCLWENINKPYPKQDQSFDDCLARLRSFTQNDMEHAIDLIEKEIEIIKLHDRIAQNNCSLRSTDLQRQQPDQQDNTRSQNRQYEKASSPDENINLVQRPRKGFSQQD